MRVAWIQDMDVWTHMGGAQQTDREIVKYGIRKGYDVDLITPGNFPAIHDMNYDLVIFSNCHVLMGVDYNRMWRVADRFPHIMWHHDYFCKYRLFFPMEEKCKNCVYLPPWKKLYKESILNIFMSPLHRDAHLYVMPELAEHPYALVPSAIDPSDYECNEPIDIKENQVCGVNVLYSFKGKSQVLNYAKENKQLSFVFAGGREGDEALPENCQHVGVKIGKELVRLYAESKYLIHLPMSPSPCDRTPVEFLIANPKGRLITNRLVGILSYPNVIKNNKINRREIIRLVTTSAHEFWKAVEKVMM